MSVEEDPCAVIKRLIAADDYEAVRKNFEFFNPSLIGRLAGKALAKKTVRMLINNMMLITHHKKDCCISHAFCDTDAQDELYTALFETREGMQLYEELYEEIYKGKKGHELCDDCGNTYDHNNYNLFAEPLRRTMEEGDVKHLQHIRDVHIVDEDIVSSLIGPEFTKTWVTCPLPAAEWLTTNVNLVNWHMDEGRDFELLYKHHSLVTFDDDFVDEQGYLCTSGMGDELIKRTRALPFNAFIKIASAALVMMPDIVADDIEIFERKKLIFIGAVLSLSSVVLTQAVIQCCMRDTTDDVADKCWFPIEWLKSGQTLLLLNLPDTIPDLITMRKAFGIAATPEGLDKAKVDMFHELVKLCSCSKIDHVLRYMSPETWERTRAILMTRNRYLKAPGPLPILPVEIWDMIIVFFSFAERPLLHL